MAHESGSGEFSSVRVPLDMRVANFATFLAEIHNDTEKTTRSNTDHGSSGSDNHEQLTPVARTLRLQTSAPMAHCPAERRSGRPRANQGGSRRRRYRDDRQKLSNSLAQKRYRERKKEAFNNMKTLVDSLTAEVDRLQYVKRENEKLTLEMEGYRQLAEMHGMAESQHPSANIASSSFKEATSPAANHLTQQNISGLLLPTERTAQHPCAVQNLSGTDWIRTLSQICQGSCSMDVSAELCLREKIELLEKEWDERLTAAENVLQLYQMYGGSTSTPSEHMIPILRSCMTSMSSMNSDIACLRVQLLSQQTQENGDRIQKAFGFAPNAPK